LKLSYKKKYRAERPEINLFKKRINPARSHRPETSLPINGECSLYHYGHLVADPPGHRKNGRNIDKNQKNAKGKMGNLIGY
jgi:hypothetical protein